MRAAVENVLCRSAARLALALALGCSAPATLPELAAAEHRADSGDYDGALAEYRLAQTTCKQLRPERRARAACGDALLGEGEVLERAGRAHDAIATYLAVPPRAPDDVTAATATYRAGKLQLAGNDLTAAWTSLWKVVTDWPDEPIAADALSTLVSDLRKRDARALADQLAQILTPLAETAVADNIVWSLAELYEHELADLPRARAFYDRIPTDFPNSGLADDARWRAANISRALADPHGAVTRLRALLATREVSLGVGSYFSIWLDDSQLLLGQILRDDLHDPRAAIAAFRRLPKDYPDSELRDDALYELAVTYSQQHQHDAACAAVRDLKKLEPDSKYIERTRDLGCPSP